MHNTRTRTDLTDWSSPTEPVMPAEYNKLDQQGFESINGDQGGVWAPLDVIEIGGEGLLVSGAFESTGGAEFSSTVQLNDNLSVDGTATFNANLIANEDVTLGNTAFDSLHVHAVAEFFANVQCDTTLRVFGNLIGEEDCTFGNSSADDLHVHATALFYAPTTFADDVYFDATIHVAGNFAANEDVTLGNASADQLHVHATSEFFAEATFDDDVTVEGDVECAGTLSVAGDFSADEDVTLGSASADALTIKATATLQTAMLFSGAGRVPARAVAGPDASTTYTAADANIVYAETLTVGRTYGIDSTGAQDGDEILFVNADETFLLTIDPDVGPLPITIRGAGDLPGWVRYLYLAGEWKRIGFDSPG